jgi:glycosyltransferase involved in cell wall biosynthesis
MKMLMATHYFASHRGGIEIVAGKLFGEFGDLGQDVVWAASNSSPPPACDKKRRAVEIDASNFAESKIGIPFPIPTLTGLSKIRKETRYADVVLIHDCLYINNICAFIFARRNKVPIVTIQHIGSVQYSNVLLRGLMKLGNATITRFILQRSDQVVFISETTRRHFEGLRFRRPPLTIFNGVDTDTFKPVDSVKTKAEICRSFGFPAEAPVILFVGRFVEKKGLAVLKQMAQLSPAYTWVFAGWGPMDPRKWNSPNVRVFSDLHGSNLAELYRASDVFVLPSTGEGFPLVIQEALASGLPTVCGLDTVTADLGLSSVAHGVSLHPTDHLRSAAAFLEVIDNLIATGRTIQERRDERRAFALSRYSWHRAAQRYIEIASHLLRANLTAESEPLGRSSENVSADA